MILNVNDERVECPICWAEASTGAFQRLYGKSGLKDGDSLIRVFALLTGLQYDDVYQAQSEDLNAGLYQVTSFVLNEPKAFKAIEPTEFVFEGKAYKIPNVKSLRVGQAFALRQTMEGGENLESLISKALAICYQPEINGGDFNYARAMEIEQEILKMPITETYPVGFFLLSKLNNSGASGLLLRLRLLRTKVKNVLQSLKQRELKNSALCMILFCLIGTANATGNYHELSSKNHLTSSSHSSYCGKSKPSIRNDITHKVK